MPALLTTSLSTKSRLGALVHSTDDTSSADATATDASTEPTPTTPAPESPAVLKAVRAYEHDRHRAKKTAETERTRERKERKRSLGAPCHARPCRTAAHAHGRRSAARGVFKGGADLEEREDALLAPVACEYEREERGAVDSETIPQRQDVRELGIHVLLKPARAHKHRADDFEVIPNVRSVIVLDDHISATPDVDEPWEHVTAEDAEKDSAPSYAQIVASAA